MGLHGGGSIGSSTVSLPPWVCVVLLLLQLLQLVRAPGAVRHRGVAVAGHRKETRKVVVDARSVCVWPNAGEAGRRIRSRIERDCALEDVLSSPCVGRVYIGSGARRSLWAAARDAAVRTAARSPPPSAPRIRFRRAADPLTSHLLAAPSIVRAVAGR